MQLPEMNPRERNILLIGSGVFAGFVLLVVLATRKRTKSLPSTRAFDSPDQPGIGNCMDEEFLRMLQALEEYTGYPIFQHINSGARTAIHNAKVGGVSNSSHKMPTCRAADVHIPNRQVQRQLVFAAKAVGFRRTFIHLDNDPDKSQNVAWGYPKGMKPPFNPLFLDYDLFNLGNTPS